MKEREREKKRKEAWRKFSTQTFQFHWKYDRGARKREIAPLLLSSVLRRDFFIDCASGSFGVERGVEGQRAEL